MKDDIKCKWPAEFVSMNEIPVPVATIKRERMEEILRQAAHASRASDEAWKRAVDDQLVIMCATADTYSTPAEAVHALIDWHVAIATDPVVSGQQRGEPVYLASRFDNGFWQECSKGRFDSLKDAAHSSTEKWGFRVLYPAPQPADINIDYKQLFDQMCERCDALDAKLAEYSEQPDTPAQQYYYQTTGCKADKATAPDCICWHDKSTGPSPYLKEGDEVSGVLVSWRVKPSAPKFGEKQMTTETILTDEQIDDAAKSVYGTMANGQELALARAIEQAVLQSPEMQALRKDAGLYRVLRDEEYQMHEDDPCVADDSFNAYFGEDLDEAVAALKSRRDAAMEQQK